MKLKYKVLLVHNPFNKKDGITYLSYGIRVATNSHWNHIAIEVDFMGIPYVLESVGEGVIINKKVDWLLSSNREVLERTPESLTINAHDILGVINERYGYIDILCIAKYLATRRFSSNVWDGKVAKGWEGLFCSELLALLEKRINPHLILPCDYEHMEGYITTNRYRTFKI